MNDVLCTHCTWWVNCPREENAVHGFCLLKDLFTYTAEKECSEHSEGLPLSEEEYEDANNPKNWILNP